MKNRHIAERRDAQIRQRTMRNRQAKAKAIAVHRNEKFNAGYLALLGLLTTAMLMLSWTFARATEIQRVVSDTGVEAWLVEDHTVPIIAMDFSFTGGTTQDTDGKEGGVSMLTSLLDEGAGDMDSQAFQSALEDNAIKLSFDTGLDRFYGSMRTLSPNKDVAFDLLAKALQAPRFDQAPVERMRAYWLSSVKQAATDPNSIASKAFREAAFPKHPYSRPAEGTVESLSAITPEDLLRLKNAIMTRDGLTIGVVGAINADDLKAMLDKVFGPLPATGALQDIPEIEAIGRGVVHVPFDAPQTTIRFGAPGIDRNEEDFYAAYLVNHILGGGTFSSRLYNEIREKRGLAYGVYSYLADYDRVAVFGGGMATRTENTEQAITLVKQEIARLGKEGPTEEELEATKKFLIGNYPLRFDSSSKISRQLVGIQNDNLGIDYFDQRNSYIEAVTLEQAKEAAKRLLDPSQLLLVTVGQQVKHAKATPHTQSGSNSNDSQETNKVVAAAKQ